METKVNYVHGQAMPNKGQGASPSLAQKINLEDFAKGSMPVVLYVNHRGEQDAIPLRELQEQLRSLLRPAAQEAECETCTGTGTVQDPATEGPPSFGFLPCPDCKPSGEQPADEQEGKK